MFATWWQSDSRKELGRSQIRAGSVDTEDFPVSGEGSSDFGGYARLPRPRSTVEDNDLSELSHILTYKNGEARLNFPT